MSKATRAAVDDVLAAHPQFDRKQRQLGSVITRSVQRTLDVDVDDDVLDGAVVDGARLAAGGVTVVVVSVVGDVDAAHARLQALVPLFRVHLARELARKRVPNLRIVAVPAAPAFGYGDDGGDDGGDDVDVPS